MNRTTRRRGFTIIELLVVISIMAVIATLATGAAIKSIKQNRNKRIDVTAKSLELALVNYRALHGQWPYTFDDPDTGDRSKQTVKGKQNAEVFKKIFEDVRAGRALIDTSALLTRVPGGRMSVRQALDKGESSVPVGYPNPEDSNEFNFFTVVYNFQTDSVKVTR